MTKLFFLNVHATIVSSLLLQILYLSSLMLSLTLLAFFLLGLFLVPSVNSTRALLFSKKIDQPAKNILAQASLFVKFY